MRVTRGHLYHHGRFYVAALLGLAVYAGTCLMGGPEPAAAGGDAFFIAYLAASAWLLARLTPHDVERRAAREDEGILIVVAIALAVIAFNIAAVFLALGARSRPDAVSLALLLAAAPLGWFVLHTISAFHYVNLHYAGAPQGEAAGRALEFPGTRSPGLWDFLYFSFVIGMTAQVSDVQVRTAKLRRAVTGHSIVSFFFNTVLIGLMVNVVVAGH